MDTVVTSFSQKGYEQYGRRFLETFDKHWPLSAELIVYYEGQFDQSDRYLSVDLLSEVQNCIDFLSRHEANEVVKGRAVMPGQVWKPACVAVGYNFRYDAYRFSRKVFAIAHAARSIEQGRLFWLDADVVTFEDVPSKFLKSLLPSEVGTSYLGRDNYHSECGFVGYNLDHPDTMSFVQRFEDVYAQDQFFSLAEWHDSWVYDYVRSQSGVPSHDISKERRGHVFVTSPLGQYMDHLKGDRKELGRSYPFGYSKVKHDHPYWRGGR